MELKKVNEVSPRAYAKKNDITREEVKKFTPEKWIVASAVGLVTLMYTSPDWSIHKIGVVFGCISIETVDNVSDIYAIMEWIYTGFLIGSFSLFIVFLLLALKNLIMLGKYSESKKERNRKKMKYLLIFLAAFVIITLGLHILLKLDLDIYKV